MSTTLTQDALAKSAPTNEVAKAAAQDASAETQSDAEKEALGLALYNAATGRFPQDSSDRKTVYLGAFVLVGTVFVLTAILVIVLVLKGKTVPDWIPTLVTALTSGVIGGLFGYAKQD